MGILRTVQFSFFTAFLAISAVFVMGCSGEREADVDARRAAAEAVKADAEARRAEAMARTVESVKSGARKITDDVRQGKYDDLIDKYKKVREPTWRESLTEVGKEFARGAGESVGN